MFDGATPSLAGLANENVISALETGLVTESELNSLLHLIRSPDVRPKCPPLIFVSPAFHQSHFLKVPSLPFHSLISLLSKFPSDIDSRVFWSGSLRDMLYGECFPVASDGPLLKAVLCDALTQT